MRKTFASVMRNCSKGNSSSRAEKRQYNVKGIQITGNQMEDRHAARTGIRYSDRNKYRGNKAAVRDAHAGGV